MTSKVAFSAGHVQDIVFQRSVSTRFQYQCAATLEDPKNSSFSRGTRIARRRTLTCMLLEVSYDIGDSRSSVELQAAAAQRLT
eukprot:197314-Rhodomonas_salina.1